MKTLDLNISERVFALGILNDFKGNLETMAVLVKDVPQISISNEDWETAGKTETKNADGSVSWQWNDEKGGLKTVEVDKKTIDYILRKIQEKNKSGEFSFRDKAVISLNEKLN